jgi:proteasome lid subunit RPN8/RPN11
MLRLAASHYREMLACCISGLPDEACGLLGGDLGKGDVTAIYPAHNKAASARRYVLDPKDFLAADRDCSRKGWEVIGVYHSHTHTDAYPSPTDVEDAPDPYWHYVVVSLRHPEPVLRSYRIVGGKIEEEPVVVLAKPSPLASGADALVARGRI